MAEMLDVMDAFSTPLKLAWVLWLAWAVGQIFWYRREGVAVGASGEVSTLPVPKPVAAPRLRRSKPETEVVGLGLSGASRSASLELDTALDESLRALDRRDVASDASGSEATPSA